MSTAWLQYVERENLYYRLLFPKHLWAAGRPIHLKAIDRSALPEDSLAFLVKFDELQGGDGVGLPLPGSAGNDGFCGVFYDHDLSSEELAVIPDLHSAMQAIHAEIVAKVLSLARDVIALSTRELDVLRLVAHAMSNRQVAESLGVSAATVDTYMRRIFQKLGTTDRIEAVLKAVSLQLLRL